MKTVLTREELAAMIEILFPAPPGWKTVGVELKPQGVDFCIINFERASPAPAAADPPPAGTEDHLS
jgi:hypothetical protein